MEIKGGDYLKCRIRNQLHRSGH